VALFGVAIVVGLLAGWLRGGSLDTLSRSGLRLLWLVPLSLAAELFIVHGVGREVPPWVWPLHVGAYALLMAIVVANWWLPGMRLIGVGLLMNAMVIALNGGLMPEAPETLHVKHAGEALSIGQHPASTKDIVLPRDQTRLWWLGDNIASPPGFPVQTVVSVGDLVVATGLAWTVGALMRQTKPADGAQIAEHVTEPADIGQIPRRTSYGTEL
jgi:hypothetical protein